MPCFASRLISILALGATACSSSPAEPPVPAPGEHDAAAPASLAVVCPPPCNRTSIVSIPFKGLSGAVDESIVVGPQEQGDRGPFRASTGSAVDGAVSFTGLPDRTALVARAFAGGATSAPLAVSAPFTIAGDAPFVSSVCSDQPCAPASTITVTFGNLPGFVDDAVAIEPAGAIAAVSTLRQLAAGHPDGAMTFTAFTAGQSLVARAYRRGDFTTPIATSAPIAIVAGDVHPGTLLLSCSEAPCRPSSTVTASFTNLPGHLHDAITFAPAGASLDQHVALQLTQGSVSGALAFTGLPAGVVLVARAFDDYDAHGLTALVAESAPLTLVAGNATLTVAPCAPPTCPDPRSVTVTYAGFPGNAGDTITFARPSAGPTEHSEVKLTGGATSGALTFSQVPAGMPIVARAFQNGDYGAELAESAPLTIEADPLLLSIGCGPTCTVAQKVLATFSGMPGFSADAITVTPWSTGSATPVGHVGTGGAVSGTAGFGTLPVGAYAVRALVDDGPDTLGAPAFFTVGPLVPVCGDGVRDPSTEACDDGNLAAGDSCSPACAITALPAAPRSPPPGPPAAAWVLGNGAHPAAAGDHGFAVAYVSDEASPAVSVALFTSAGKPLAVQPLSADASALATSDPVVAALPDGRFVAAWTDLAGGALGDGDGLGIALRVVEPGAAPGPIGHANHDTAFNQYAPDIAVTPSQIVVAWVDESSATATLRVKYRLLATDLTPLGDDAALVDAPSVTDPTDSDVTLAPWGATWAAAWRVAAAAGEMISVAAPRSAPMEWTVGPFAAAPVGMKPALVAMDDHRLLLVFATGDPTAANGARLRAVILDGQTAGGVIDVSATQVVAEGGGRPSAARVGSSLFVSWDGAAGAGQAGPHVWAKEIPAVAPLDLSRAAEPLAREARYAGGDRGRSALAASPLVPTGGLVGAWNDVGQSFGNSKGDVGVQLVPLPR